ncbi:hypothetical protein JW948_09245 [bacterium]|nr:hypothetical protein [bacterium]
MKTTSKTQKGDFRKGLSGALNGTICRFSLALLFISGTMIPGVAGSWRAAAYPIECTRANRPVSAPVFQPKEVRVKAEFPEVVIPKVKMEPVKPYDYRITVPVYRPVDIKIDKFQYKPVKVTIDPPVKIDYNTVKIYHPPRQNFNFPNQTVRTGANRW